MASVDIGAAGISQAPIKCQAEAHEMLTEHREMVPTQTPLGV